MESDSVLINGHLQTDLETQIKSAGYSDQAFEESVTENSQIQTSKRKKRFILWTPEQMKVLAKVYSHLTTPQEIGMRLLVLGGKGSGKTMLLVALAKFAASVIEEATGDTSCVVTVMESSFQSVGLQMMFNEQFKSNNIAVFNNSSMKVYACS